MAIWLKDHIQVKSSEEHIAVVPGFDITSVHPARRKQVPLMLMGLEQDVPDQAVIEYIKLFGIKPVDQSAERLNARGGLWRGQANGDRRLKVDLSDSVDFPPLSNPPTTGQDGAAALAPNSNGQNSLLAVDSFPPLLPTLKPKPVNKTQPKIPELRLTKGQKRNLRNKKKKAEPSINDIQQDQKETNHSESSDSDDKDVDSDSEDIPRKQSSGEETKEDNKVNTDLNNAHINDNKSAEEDSPKDTLKEEEEAMEKLYKSIVENNNLTDTKEEEDPASILQSPTFFEDNQYTIQQTYQSVFDKRRFSMSSIPGTPLGPRPSSRSPSSSTPLPVPPDIKGTPKRLWIPK